MRKTSFVYDLAHTAKSLGSATLDWLVLRTPLARLIEREQTFAFLVHPRTDVFVGSDVYGENDIYRPFPILRRLFNVLPHATAEKIVRWFAKTIVPITLSRIRVRVGEATFRGYLLSTVRTPRLLLGKDADETKRHLVDLFRLASNKGVRRVGLGALLPSMTGYGKRYSCLQERPAISTGHAYTAYTIGEYLKFLVNKRSNGSRTVRAAIVGAGGSTGKALMRVLKKTWNLPVHLELMLVDVPKKEFQLHQLAKEAAASGRFASVQVSTELAALHEVQYVTVVTNASGAIIKPEHLSPGTVVIDDSQPRNTAPELLEHGCYVVDVLARVPGLDVGFDFGFKTSDHSVTFTCLAETVLATVTGDKHDLAVGEVTDDIVERTLKIVELGTQLGLIGDLPFFSFGRELSAGERNDLLKPAPVPYAPAAE